MTTDIKFWKILAEVLFVTKKSKESKGQAFTRKHGKRGEFVNIWSV